MRRLLFLILFSAVIATPRGALAQIYRWIDDKGTPHFVEGIDNVPERYRANVVPLGLRNVPSTDAPAAAATATADGKTTLRFEPGRHILVDARINGGSTVKLILDTGAAQTMISPRALTAAGVAVARDGRSTKARGVVRDVEIEVHRVSIDSLEVGGARVGRFQVASYEMAMDGVEGLLGQDFLGHFNVSIDSGAGVVKLTKK